MGRSAVSFNAYGLASWTELGWSLLFDGCVCVGDSTAHSPHLLLVFLWNSLHPLLSQSLKKSRGLGRCMGLVSSIFQKCCNFFITGTFLGVIGSSTGTFLAFLKPVRICSCIKMWLHGKGCLASPWRPKTQHSYEPPTIFSGNLDVVANSGLLSFYTSDQKTFL